MACSPTNPCLKPTCQKCPTPPATSGCPLGDIDSSCVKYHLTPGQVSKLTCLGLANGVNLTQILEAIDKKLCQSNLPSPAALNLGCLVPSGGTRPATFNGVIELLAAVICQVKSDTSLTNLISQLLANSTFINGLASLLANNATFINALLNNQDFLTRLARNSTFVNALVNNPEFTTALANNSNFVTALANNQEFVTKIGNSLISSSSFLSSLVNAIVNNPGLKDQFCCGTSPSPCAGMVVNGVTLTDCSCIPPQNLQITGDSSVPSGTSTTYTLGYSGTPGQVTWSITGGTIISQSSTQATVQFTGTGILKATLVGCNGVAQEATKTVTLSGSACTPVTGLTINGTTTTFSASQTAGTPLTYNWSVGGGIIQGSSTGSSINVAWSTGTRVINLSVTDCSGIAKNTSKTLSTSCLEVDSVAIQGNGNVAAGIQETYHAVANGTGPLSYSWTNGNGDFIIDSQTDTARINWSGTNATTLTLTVTGCGVSKTVTIPIQIGTATISNLSYTPTPGSMTGALNVTFDNSNGVGPYTYTLSQGGSTIETGNL